MRAGFLHSVTAGFFAALAAVFAKLAFNSKSIHGFLCPADHETMPGFLASWNITWISMLNCETVTYLLRFFAVMMILACNAIMFRSFSQSLLLSKSTAEATITNSAANFCFSGVFGWLLFDESCSVRWCLGVSIIFAGLALINKSRELPVQKDKKLQ